MIILNLGQQFASNVHLISFTQAIQKLNAGNFLNFNFLTEYQTIPHRTGNYIATFYGKDENIYLTEVQYNQTNNQIFPPS